MFLSVHISVDNRTFIKVKVEESARLPPDVRTAGTSDTVGRLQNIQKWFRLCADCDDNKMRLCLVEPDEKQTL